MTIPRSDTLPMVKRMRYYYCDVVQMKMSTFITHYQYIVPFGEIVVKYAVGHELHFLYM